MIQSNIPELVGMDATLAELVSSGKVKLDEAEKWAEDPRYLTELATLHGGRKRGH
jgi:hypothetical protein